MCTRDALAHESSGRAGACACVSVQVSVWACALLPAPSGAVAAGARCALLLQQPLPRGWLMFVHIDRFVWCTALAAAWAGLPVCMRQPARNARSAAVVHPNCTCVLSCKRWALLFFAAAGLGHIVATTHGGRGAASAGMPAPAGARWHVCRRMRRAGLHRTRTFFLCIRCHPLTN